MTRHNKQGWKVTAILFALLVAWIGAPQTQAAPEPRVASCSASGRLGNPTVKNIGPRNPVKLSRGGVFGTKNSLYVGSAERWCPSHVYVHSGYDVLVRCSNGRRFARTSYGWQKLLANCSWNGGSSYITFNEYKQ